jgi:biopolymer transport protein ExbB/TolQ
MQLALLMGALVAIAGLTAGLIYAVKQVAQAHANERTATAEQSRLERELHESQTQQALTVQSNDEFRAANDRLAQALEQEGRATTTERTRAERAERQRDDLIRKLAARQDPAALVDSINAELASLASR